MHYVIVGIIFFSVFFLVLSFHFLREDRRAREKRKLLIRLLSKTEEGTSGRLLESRMGGAFEKSLSRFIDLRSLTRLLEDADITIPVGRFLTYCVMLGLAMFFLAAIILVNLIAMTIGLAVGSMAPVGYLLVRRRKREIALVSQLPDAIDMLSRGLRAGQGLDAALKEVARAFSDPVGAELKLIYEEMAMGLSFKSAIRNFERRFHRVSDVKILCAALLIQRETGGNLTTILDNIAHTIRERFTFYRQVRALSAEGRISAVILGSLPLAFGLITWVLRPEYIFILFTHPAGKAALMASLLLEAVGFALMFHLARVEA